MISCCWGLNYLTKASKDNNSLQASYVDVGVCTGAYVDFNLVVYKFLINLQLQTSKSMVTWAIFLWQRWQKSLTNKFNFFSQVLSGVDEVLSNLDQPSLCFSLIRFLPPHTSSHCLCYGCGLKMYNALITIRKTFLVDCFQKDWSPPQKIARL